MHRFLRLVPRSSFLLASLSLFLCSSPIYGSCPGPGSIEIKASFTGSHAEGRSDEEDEADYLRSYLELDIGMGYFFTDRLEFMPRIQWTSSSSGKRGDFSSSSGGSRYGISGMFILNRATTSAGVLYLGFGAGVSASTFMQIEPVQFPIFEGGTRVFLSDSASLNLSVYYERQRFQWGFEDTSANAYGLRFGFSLFPLASTGTDGEGK